MRRRAGSRVGLCALDKTSRSGYGRRRADLPALAEPALFVPETMTLMKLLEQFKRTHLPVALVVDEFGDTKGLVSLTDVTSSIVGDLPAEPGEEP